MDWTALKNQIVLLLIDAGKETVAEFQKEYEKYVRNLALWTVKAIQSGDLIVLESVKGQVKLLAAKQQLSLQRKTMTTLTTILDIVMKSLFSFVQGAVL